MPKSKDAGRAATEQAKRERRLERQRQEAAARHRAARRRRLKAIALVVLAVVALGVGGYWSLRPDPEVDGVTKLSTDGRDHVTGANFDTATPTSGDHSASAPACGRRTEALEPELAVHALEHGAVVVWYRPDVSEEARAAAGDLLREWDSHWILSPNSDIETPFVATAWNRLKAFDEAGAGLREFVDTYRRRGPERVDCAA